ncbi:hypothetical protein Ciccas_008912, partial [Cichlidogyrus casuarinus]
VCHPLKRRILCRPQRIKYVILTLTLITSVFCIYRVIFFKTRSGEHSIDVNTLLESVQPNLFTDAIKKNIRKKLQIVCSMADSMGIEPQQLLLTCFEITYGMLTTVIPPFVILILNITIARTITIQRKYRNLNFNSMLMSGKFTTIEQNKHTKIYKWTKKCLDPNLSTTHDSLTNENGSYLNLTGQNTKLMANQSFGNKYYFAPASAKIQVQNSKDLEVENEPVYEDSNKSAQPNKFRKTYFLWNLKRHNKASIVRQPKISRGLRKLGNQFVITLLAISSCFFLLNIPYMISDILFRVFTNSSHEQLGFLKQITN